MSFDPKELKDYPAEPGVYLMKDSANKVLYVGKANHLRNRLKQYFAPKGDNRAMVPVLVSQVHQIDTLIVTSEKEALLLENTLIKKHQPKYNALLKDDKTFISLMINHQHPWPRVQLVRYKGKPTKGALYFGPYTSAYAARQIFELITKMFPLRQCSDEELKRRTRPCILYSLKRCIAPCVNKCTKQEYNLFVESVIAFLKGEDKKILHSLYEEMNQASDKLQFEKADALLKTIRQIEHVTQAKPSVVKTKTPDADALAIYRQADLVLLVQLLFREGNLVGSEHYSFSEVLEDDQELITSFILQHYNERSLLPKEILLPCAIDNALALFEILGKKTHLITPYKGEKQALVELAKKNAESLFKQKVLTKDLQEKILLDLQELLHLSRYPKRIECFDTSNISGSDLVATLATFVEGVKDKTGVRHYKIRNITKADDYGALHQVLSRRLIRAKDEDTLPDLIIVDGGKGQLNIALDVFKELDIASVDVISLAKEEGRHDKGITQERVFLPHHPEPILLHPRSPLMFFLQNIRDTAHSQAISFHRKRRTKRLLTTSLDAIEGIGPIKRKRLLSHFGSVQRIRSASAEELKKIKGITQKDIEKLIQS